MASIDDEHHHAGDRRDRIFENVPIAQWTALTRQQPWVDAGQMEIMRADFERRTSRE